MTGPDDDKILPDQRPDLVLTLKMALGEVRPFRPPPGSPDRDVWGKLSEDRRKEIAEGLIRKMAAGNWYIRKGAPAEPHYTGRGYRVQTQDSRGDDPALVRLFTRLSLDEIVEAFGVTERPEALGGNWPPAYNIAAGALLPVVRYNPATGRRHLDLIRWGLIPRSAKDETVGAQYLAYSETLPATGDELLALACRMGLEGVVSKRADSTYRSGAATAWIKSKCVARESFVIGGWLPASGPLDTVGSLLLGQMDHGALRYVGRVGTGISGRAAAELAERLGQLRAGRSPFRAGEMSAGTRKAARYARPELVAEVEIRGWTGDGKVRHASFKALRADMAPVGVRRER